MHHWTHQSRFLLKNQIKPSLVPHDFLLHTKVFDDNCQPNNAQRIKYWYTLMNESWFLLKSANDMFVHSQVWNGGCSNNLRDGRDLWVRCGLKIIAYSSCKVMWKTIRRQLRPIWCLAALHGAHADAASIAHMQCSSVPYTAALENPFLDLVSRFKVAIKYSCLWYYHSCNKNLLMPRNTRNNSAQSVL